jgi:hypothetical protein
MRRIIRLTALLICASIFFGACAGKKQQTKDVSIQKDMVTASLDSSFQLKHNQTAIIESEELTIQFTDVVEDSRCPVGVECVWPGQARIELEIKQKDEEPDKITLISLAGQDELAVRQVNNYFIRLLKVEPPRQKDVELKPSDYNITLLVSRNLENLSQ